jgi:cytochrome oxidase assembly protein ShyY1
VLRTALKPRWLALLALVLGVIVGFTTLGLWQLDVARDEGTQQAQTEALARPVVPLTSVARPSTALSSEAVGRVVTAVGRYDQSRQTLITGRRLGDAVGMWVMTPLILDDGALLPVVRGFVTDPAQAGLADQGRLTVTGMLAPPEAPPDRKVDLPPGRLATLDLADLVNRWDAELYSGFIFATGQAPPMSPAAARVTPVPPPQAQSGAIQWRNLAYALQWWLFAGFALYMWWRMVRDDHLTSQRHPGDVLGVPTTPARV